MSALTGAGVDEVVAGLVELLPEGPFLYPPDEKSDLALEVRLAELVREQVLRRTREEVLHSVEVEIDELEERDDGLLVVRARLGRDRVAEGHPRRARRADGEGGRHGCTQGDRGDARGAVHLELNVRVRKAWRRDEGLLDRLGIE